MGCSIVQESESLYAKGWDVPNWKNTKLKRHLLLFYFKSSFKSNNEVLIFGTTSTTLTARFEIFLSLRAKQPQLTWINWKKRLFIVINTLFVVPLVRTHSVSQPRIVTIIQPLKDDVKHVCLTNGILKQFKVISYFAQTGSFFWNSLLMRFFNHAAGSIFQELYHHKLQCKSHFRSIAESVIREIFKAEINWELGKANISPWNLIFAQGLSPSQRLHILLFTKMSVDSPFLPVLERGAN